ncbi:U4/U6 small nuclear ribonucleoprotein Prp31 [Striga asiatica]|uniref:U4/U6 small nuclear ribonucleoprotein Prp31 n=1 Tax=Striga asiatica TaxID=4170 RepID=A0A5A7QH70_STRAF|nr:U4/U6 small nuclear ribonucleoprotein Prp31 [Striga asiatica]
MALLVPSPGISSLAGAESPARICLRTGKRRYRFRVCLGLRDVDREWWLYEQVKQSEIETASFSAVKRKDEEGKKHDYYVNTGYAFRTLREEFPELFYRELSFDIYSLGDNHESLMGIMKRRPGCPSTPKPTYFEFSYLCAQDFLVVFEALVSVAVSLSRPPSVASLLTPTARRLYSPVTPSPLLSPQFSRTLHSRRVGALSDLMATLNDSFLADLDELSDIEEEHLEGEDDDAEHMEDDVDGNLADIEALNYDDLDSVSKLQKTQRYTNIMQLVIPFHSSSHGTFLEDDPEYLLIVDCNALMVDIDNEIAIVHNFVRDKYRLKFPELESLVPHPIDYARLVKKIGNEMDLTLVDLEGLLPSATIMVVSVTASTTSGKPLQKDVLEKTIDACDRALSLDSAKKKLLDFVESRIGYIAPNLSAVVGGAVAAKLMGTAGGLTSLAKMPACNVQLLGAKRKNLAGFSTAATSQFRVGFLDQTEIFNSTPDALKMRVCRLLAAKSTLAARVDSTKGDPSGGTGRAFRAEIHKKIDKWQEPPPAKQPKPLPVPDSEPKKKRGGDGLGEGYGMLGQAGNGKLRVSVGQSRLAAKVAKKFKDRNYGSSGGATSGLTSSLAFTPVQGIELSNPQANQLGGGTSTYFSETGTFSKIKRT